MIPASPAAEFFKKFAVQQGVESVEVKLGTRHGAEWRGQFVLLPFSFRAHDNDLVPERSARVVIVLPIFGHEDFEDGMGPEALPGRAGKANGMFREIVGHQFGMAGLGNSASRQGEIVAWASPLRKATGIELRAESVFAREEIGEPTRSSSAPFLEIKVSAGGS